MCIKRLQREKEKKEKNERGCDADKNGIVI